MKIMKERCAECLFGKDRIVSGDRASEIIRECQRQDSHFLCHKGTIAGIEIQCRGYYDLVPSQMTRIAGRLGMIEFVAEPDQEITKIPCAEYVRVSVVVQDCIAAQEQDNE